LIPAAGPEALAGWPAGPWAETADQQSRDRGQSKAGSNGTRECCTMGRSVQAGWRAATRWARVVTVAPFSISHRGLNTASAGSGAPASWTRRPAWGLVLSGGRVARGFATLGVHSGALGEARSRSTRRRSVSIEPSFGRRASPWAGTMKEIAVFRLPPVESSTPTGEMTITVSSGGPLDAGGRKGRKVFAMLRGGKYGRRAGSRICAWPFLPQRQPGPGGRCFRGIRGGTVCKHALRRSVAIPGVMPACVPRREFLVGGGTARPSTKNLPVGPSHGSGLCARSRDRRDRPRSGAPIVLGPDPTKRLTFFSDSHVCGIGPTAREAAAAQRTLADVLLQPPLANVDCSTGGPSDRSHRGARFMPQPAPRTRGSS